MKAKVYGSSHCVWCDRVAKMLEDSGADIEKVDVSQGKEIIKEMQEAAGETVNTCPQVIIDGNKLPKINYYNLKSIIKGDQKIPEISAASIIAKVSRDRLVSKMSKKFKKYLWNKNSGYGTKDHIKAIKKFGITKHHRKTFLPIHNILSPR